jgi:aspartate racemase
MRMIGLLGGMSWESTAVYYRLLNQEVRNRRGGLASAPLLLWSVDFAEIEALQAAGRWQEAGLLLGRAARRLQDAGARLVILCSNTMHIVADDIVRNLNVPFVHIADATAAAVRRQGLRRVGLLATAYTMEQDFYAGRLRDSHGIEVRVPAAAERAEVHRIIYEELCLGIIREESRAIYRRVITSLVADGAEAVIFGCTEIGLLISQEDSVVPVFDSTVLHVLAAVDLAGSQAPERGGRTNPHPAVSPLERPLASAALLVRSARPAAAAHVPPTRLNEHHGPSGEEPSAPPAEPGGGATGSPPDPRPPDTPAASTPPDLGSAT